MWYSIFAALESHLKTELGVGTRVTLGFDGAVPEETAVRIGRGKPEHVKYQYYGKEEALIECWVYNKDTKKAYEALDSLETKVKAALFTFEGNHDGSLIEVFISRMDADYDLFRPSSGSRITVVLTWRPYEVPG